MESYSPSHLNFSAKEEGKRARSTSEGKEGRKRPRKGGVTGDGGRHDVEGGKEGERRKESDGKDRRIGHRREERWNEV